ncbi:hypothetical protein EYF80_023899 [Liparis tanakae]|uniref:Uncharacterized protein n=1 Tax=Liparis tanakae TaxID=230148 RepID=A0A4Z2HJ16_9TELE|nr:hypothetical protein EYF80_023899 [Liparis tanakae]
MLEALFAAQQGRVTGLRGAGRWIPVRHNHSHHASDVLLQNSGIKPEGDIQTGHREDIRHQSDTERTSDIRATPRGHQTSERHREDIRHRSDTERTSDISGAPRGRHQQGTERTSSAGHREDVIWA